MRQKCKADGSGSAESLQKNEKNKRNQKMLMSVMLFVTPAFVQYYYHRKINEGGSDHCEEFHDSKTRNVPAEHLQSAECHLAGNGHMGRQERKAAVPECSGID